MGWGEAFGKASNSFIDTYTKLQQNSRANEEAERLKAAQAIQEQVQQAKLAEYTRKGLMDQAIKAKAEEVNKPFTTEFLDPTTGKTETGKYDNMYSYWEHQGKDPNEEYMKMILPVVSQHDPKLAVQIASQLIKSKTMREIAGERNKTALNVQDKRNFGKGVGGGNTTKPVPTWETNPVLKYKVETDHSKYTEQANDLANNMQNLKTNALDLMDHPGLAANLGWSGKVPNLPEGKAAEARRLMDTITSQSALTTLQNIRKNSPTGGAVGNVSDKDIELLKSYIVALNRATSVKDYQRALKDMVDFADSKTENTKSDYKRRWEKYESIYKPELLSSYGKYSLSEEEQEAFGKGAKKPGNYEINGRILYYNGKDFTHRNRKN